jgi:hypothetical protein
MNTTRSEDSAAEIWNAEDRERAEAFADAYGAKWSRAAATITESLKCSWSSTGRGLFLHVLHSIKGADGRMDHTASYKAAPRPTDG